MPVFTDWAKKGSFFGGEEKKNVQVCAGVMKSSLASKHTLLSSFTDVYSIQSSDHPLLHFLSASMKI